jgi:hypothetical protein
MTLGKRLLASASGSAQFKESNFDCTDSEEGSIMLFEKLRELFTNRPRVVIKMALKSINTDVRA